MPRKARIDMPGAIHHIIGRGINRQKIFMNKTDYYDFLERLGKIVSETRTSCYAWALIPNHFHLLLKTGDTSISNVMQRLLTGYVAGYNRRHRRSGHLFQNRYKSILCQEDLYLLELVRYIHLNPLRAKLVPDYQALYRHPYCGHGVILGYKENGWQDTDYVLRLFGDKERKAREGYDDFVQKGLEEGKRPDLAGGGLLRSHGGWTAVKALRKSGSSQKGDERILGDSDFVGEVLSRAEEVLDERTRLQREGYDLDKLSERVGDFFGMKPAEVMEKGKEKDKVTVRSLLCYLATDKLGISQSELAKRLKITQPAVSQSVRRGRSLIKQKAYSSLCRNL